jgi:hypothetical protein
VVLTDLSAGMVAAPLGRARGVGYDADVADFTVRAFGLENGRAMLEAHFESVELRR